mgnify:CR=1 FL=1
MQNVCDLQVEKCLTGKFTRTAKSSAPLYFLPPVICGVKTTGLRTALWRYDLGAELPQLAETCRSIGVLSNIVCQIKFKHLLMSEIDAI